MATPNDVTIDIPLNTVPSQGHPGTRTTSHQSYFPPTGKYESSFGYSNGQTPAESQSDLIGGPGGPGPGRRRRHHTEAPANSGEEGEEGTVTTVGRFYQAVLNFSVVTRYFIYVLPLGILLAIPIIVGATAAKYAKIGHVPIYWFFTWLEVVWVSLWVTKIVAHFIPHVFQFLCGIVSSGTKKYALVLRKLEIPITLLLWAIVSLVTFLPIMAYNPATKAEDVRNWEKSVKNILFALLVLSIIYLAEKTLVHLISMSYHRKQFDSRIKQNKRHMELVAYLYEASRNMFPLNCPEFRQEDATISDSFNDAGKGSGSMTPLNLLKGVGKGAERIGAKVSEAFGTVAQEITGKQVFNNNSPRAIVIQALGRPKSTEALARRIWLSCVAEGRESLYQEDVVEVLGQDREEEAQECFAALDRDENGDVSLDEMILTLGEFGRTRKTLSHSVHDVDQAINVLDGLLMGVASIVGALVFVSFVTSGFGTVIAACATSLLSLSFVFAATAAEVLGSCIFLFVKHPFDVGDRVEILDKPYVVERISLLYSVFRNVSDNRISQVANNILANIWVDNFTRANAMREQLTVPASLDTSFTRIQMLKEEMEKFVRDKDNCRDFKPDVNIEVLGLGSMDKLEIRVDICHKSNWAIETIRASRRSKFMCALVKAVRKVPIRAPGAEVPAEEKDDDDTNKPDSNSDEKPKDSSTQDAKGLFASDAAEKQSDAKTTGVDLGIQGAVQQRATAAAAAVGASAIIDQTALSENQQSTNTDSQDTAQDSTTQDASQQ